MPAASDRKGKVALITATATGFGRVDINGDGNEIVAAKTHAFGVATVAIAADSGTAVVSQTYTVAYCATDAAQGNYNTTFNFDNGIAAGLT